MKCVTKIQRVDRKTTQSFYVIVPTPLGQAFKIDKGEAFEWIIEDRNTLILKRLVKEKTRLNSQSS